MSQLQYAKPLPWIWETTWSVDLTSCASTTVNVAPAPLVLPPPLEPEFVRISYIESGNRRFALSRELRPCLKQEGLLWSCELDDLHIMGYGYSLEEAIKRFFDDFAVAYDGLADKADDRLTADARQLRDALSGLVARITPVEYELDVDRQRPRASAASLMCSSAA